MEGHIQLDRKGWMVVNNPHRASCTVCEKDFGIGHSGEGDVKAHLEIEPGKFRMREVSASKQTKKCCLLGKWNQPSVKSVDSSYWIRVGVLPEQTCLVLWVLWLFYETEYSHFSWFRGSDQNILWLYDEFTDVSSWAVTTSLWKQWVDVFEEMNSYKSKNLSLLISKIPSIPCSNICVEWIFSLMSSHWTEPQCHMSVRTELQVRENLTLDRVYPVLPLHQREGYPEGCKQLRKLLLEKKTERMKVFYHILGQKEICHLLNMGNTCLILFIFSF